MAGNVPARDVIPWPRVTAAQYLLIPGVGGPRTINCNRATILALAWRVREFTIAGDASVTVEWLEDLGGGDTRETTLTVNWEIPETIAKVMRTDNPGGLAATTESHIVEREDEAQFPAGLHFLHNAGTLGENFDTVNVNGRVDSILFDPPDPPVATGHDFNHDSAQQSTLLEIFGLTQPRMAVVFDPGTGLFYPHIGFAAAVNSGEGKPTAGVAGSGTDGTFKIVTGIAPDIEIPMQATAEIGSDTLLSIEGTFDITATATKFWEHGGTWDQLTGAQLLSPFRP